jgi:DNA polymerase
MNSKRLNIALDNTIRSRPLDEKGKNRVPTSDEVKHCLPYLWKRIEELQPSVIVPLGASAAGDLIASAKGKPISSVRGRKFNVRGYIFIPTFHPAAMLHSKDLKTIDQYSEKIDRDLELAIKEIDCQLSLI